MGFPLAALEADEPGDEMSELYFAYGSNLWLDQMVKRTGPIRQGEDRPRIARLPGHRLSFNVRGENNQVFANVRSPGKRVRGVVYCCSLEALEKLDAYEHGYERRRVLVERADGETLEAFTYMARPENVVSGR